MSELAKIPPQQLDGFDTFEDAVEGEEGRVSSGLIQGERIAFTNEAEWVVASSGLKLPPDLELLLWDVLRVVNKWPTEPGPPIEARVLGPGEKIPDIKKLNKETPKEEWRMGPSGEEEGPYQFQYLVYLFNETTSGDTRGPPPPPAAAFACAIVSSAQTSCASTRAPGCMPW